MLFMQETSDVLEFTIRLALDAGTLLREHFGSRLQVETKSSDIDPVTEADHASEELIVSGIQETFPDHAILAEESGKRAGSGALWIIDPLDGTVNFSRGHPHYCVSIALYEDGIPQLGVIYDPELDELFWARRGAGAWLRRRDGNVRKLRVPDTARLRSSVIATGFSYRRDSVEHNNLAEVNEVILHVQGVRRAGAAALDLAYVAAGRLDGYWEYYMKPWDTGAGACLVIEAGGQLATIEGDRWDPWQESTVAAGPALLPHLLETLQRARRKDSA